VSAVRKSNRHGPEIRMRRAGSAVHMANKNKNKPKASTQQQNAQQKAAGDHLQVTTGNAPRDYPLVPLTDAIRGLEASYCANQEKNSISQKQQLAVQIVLCIVTFLAFIAAAVYAGITYGQRQDVRNNFEADERAWVGVKNIAAKLVEKDGIPTLQVSASFFNYGKSPALRASIHSDLTLAHLEPIEEITRNPSEAQTDRSATTIFPGEVTSRMRYTTTPTQSQNLYYWGSIKYTDTFGRPHNTTWCTHYDISTNEFIFCATYNQAN
jgi:hypothetical protein